MRVRAMVLVTVLTVGAVTVAPSSSSATEPAAAGGAGTAEVGAEDWKQISASTFHTCGVRTSGRLFCWGRDNHGQLGNGAATADQAIPVEVAGGATNWAGVSTGASHTCARATTGRLYCWGRDLESQLGNGATSTDQVVPVEVAGGATNWASVSAGGFHTCARKTTGRLYCWGSDSNGQLGDGTGPSERVSPREVSGGRTDWGTVSAGGSTTCGRRTTGRLFCWGNDGDGQLGNGGADTDRQTPAQVAGAATNWASVSAGGILTCGRKTNGRLFCWGDDFFEQLGNGAGSTDQPSPVPVAGGATDWASVDAGGGYACGRRTTGRLYCWGSNGDGRLGHGGPLGSLEAAPVEVDGAATDWASVSTGGTHTCARRTSGELWCWGNDTNSGQLGDGVPDADQATPVPLEDSAADWASVSSGGNHTCAIRRSGRLSCWGDDSNGQLGDGGANADQSLPVEVAGGFTDWVAVTAGGLHTCGRRASGHLYCWGDDAFGQVGDSGANTDRPTPVQVAGTWATVSAGGSHTCARTAGGVLSCWGFDGSGQVGDGGSNTNRTAPRQVNSLFTDWRAISAGGGHTCARRSTGQLYCWGSDLTGQLGDGGTNTNRGSPFQVAGAATDWTDISAGGLHTCGVRTTGRLYCWGHDAFGAQGDGGGNTLHPTPVEVAGATTDWAAVSAGSFHTCARKVDSTLWCWGFDDAGQVGDGGTDTDQFSPVLVAGGLTNWAEVDIGGVGEASGHSCARTSSDQLWCWGFETDGQLGDDTPDADRGEPGMVRA